MPTTNPVPSTDPGDLLYNAQKLDEVVTGTADSYTDRLGVSRLTLTGAMRLLGYEAPVAFASGLSITRASQTVTNGGNTYHANPASLPFTTTAAFNASQWRVINNITYADMTGYAIPKAGATDLAASFKTTGTWSGSRFEVDANFAASIIGSIPTITFDAGDALRYNRSSNAFEVVVDGAVVCSIPATGPERASDAATANGLVRKSQMDAGLNNTGGGWFRKLNVSATGSNANVSVVADAVVLLSTSGTAAPQVVTPNITINSSATGANGLDTGTLAASTWYSVWVIWNGTTAAGLLSLSATSPVMPSGYTHRARVGWIRTDGSANRFPLCMRQFGRRAEWSPSASANITSYPTVQVGSTSGAAVSVSVASAAPTTACCVLIRVRTNGVANASVAAAKSSDACVAYGDADVGVVNQSSGYTLMSVGQVLLQTEQTIFVKSSNDPNSSVSVVGWEDNL